MTTPKKGRASGDDKDDARTEAATRRAEREAEDGKRDTPENDDARREAYLDISREAETIDEASSRQEALAQRFPQSLEYPAWIYCDDGRSQVVNSEDEANEVKASGGNWQEEPYPEHPSVAPIPPAPTPLPAYPGLMPSQLPSGPGGRPAFGRPDQGLPSGPRPRPDNTLPEGPEPKGDASKKK